MAGSNSALPEGFARSAPMSGSSNRAFGLVFAGFFTILAGLSWWRGGHFWPWYLGAATAFGAAALLVPSTLTPLNRVWTSFGALLHKIVNPIIMSVIFFGVFVPLGLLMRVVNKRPLDLRFHADTTSYWRKRPAGSQDPEAMTRQF
jgi:hypothetical protein